MGQRGEYSARTGPPKKDRQSVEGVRREIDEETRGGTAAPTLHRDRNRDAARGDWDRTNRRFDQGNSRDDEPGAEPRPEELYAERMRDDEPSE